MEDKREGSWRLVRLVWLAVWDHPIHDNITGQADRLSKTRIHAGYSAVSALRSTVYYHYSGAAHALSVHGGSLGAAVQCYFGSTDKDLDGE